MLILNLNTDVAEIGVPGPLKSPGIRVGRNILHLTPHRIFLFPIQWNDMFILSYD